ncbi:olfactory receptor 51E1-like [Lithobates pipiens]
MVLKSYYEEEDTPESYYKLMNITQDDNETSQNFLFRAIELKDHLLAATQEEGLRDHFGAELIKRKFQRSVTTGLKSDHVKVALRQFEHAVMMNSSGVYGLMPSEFVLLGLSWIEGQKQLAAFIFMLMYLTTVLANCSIVTLVKMDRKLHEPMHIFISFLAVIDLSVCSTVIPKAMAILWFGFNTINSNSCLVQMYVLYTMLGMQSSLFALMSFDRYVAICRPLHHSIVMKSSFIVKCVVLIISRSTLLLIPIPAMAARMTYCKPNVIPHSYCEYIDVIKLWCGDPTSVVVYMIILLCLFPGGDNVLVVFSYVNILNVINRLRSSQAWWKSFSTCSSHAILLSLFYISSAFPLFLFLYYPDSPLYLKTITEILSFLLLPMINPIVYGAKTKEIQDGFKRLYCRMFRIKA